MVKLIQFPARRITPEVLLEILQSHSSCVMDQNGKCPLLRSIRSMVWEINQFMGCASEEDRGFKRHSEMLAARPLHRVLENYCEEADENGDGRID